MDNRTVTESEPFCKTILDSPSEQIAAIDADGTSQYVNAPWLEFRRANGVLSRLDWLGVDYPDACDAAAECVDEPGRIAADDVRGLIDGTQHEACLEYPCHGPFEERWFTARMTPLHIDGSRYFVVSHHDMTERKLSERRAMELSRTDSRNWRTGSTSMNSFTGNGGARCDRAMHCRCCFWTRIISNPSTTAMATRPATIVCADSPDPWILSSPGHRTSWPGTAGRNS